MWWKLTGLALIETALIAVMFMPIETHAVKLDMPVGMSETQAQHTAEIFMTVMSWAVSALVLLVLAIPPWLAWRTIRKHRRAD